MASLKPGNTSKLIDDNAGPIYTVQHACLVLKDNKFTDWIIECDSSRFNVHRISLYYKSAFFRVAMDSHFKEKQKGVLKIGEAKPRTVALIILYCYTGKIERSALEKAWPKIFASDSIKQDLNEEAQDLCDLYQLSDRLMLNDLKLKSADQFMACWLGMLGSKTLNGSNVTEALQYCYQNLQDEDDLRAALSTVVFHQLRSSDALIQVVKKHDRMTFVALTISSRYHNSGGGPAHTLRELLIAAQSRA